MEKVKENLPKIAAITAISGITFYVIYKLFKRSGAPATNGGDPLVEAIDPRASIAVKAQEAQDIIKAYFKSKNFEVEKGRLARKDFQELQKVMNFYAKSILHEKKLASQSERISLYEKDFELYLDTVMDQFKNEFEAYNEALELVCESAQISQKVFNETYANEPLDSQAILGELRNQVGFSPFRSMRGFSKERAIEMFRNVAQLTLHQI